MKNKTLSLFMALIFLLASGCQTVPSVPEEHQGTAKGAAVGAAAGAVLGAVIGGDTKSAVIGGLIGALVGGAIGQYYYDQKKTRPQTAKDHAYDPSKGPSLKIEEASVDPQTIGPGGTVNLKMTYAVLTPSEGTRLEIAEKREIRFQGELVGNPEVKVSRAGGAYTSNIPLTLPATAKKGLYVVTSSVAAQQSSDTIETAFTVR